MPVATVFSTPSTSVVTELGTDTDTDAGADTVTLDSDANASHDSDSEAAVAEPLCTADGSERNEACPICGGQLRVSSCVLLSLQKRRLLTRAGIMLFQFEGMTVCSRWPLTDDVLALVNDASLFEQAIGLTVREKGLVRKALRVMATEKTTAYVSARAEQQQQYQQQQQQYYHQQQQQQQQSDRWVHHECQACSVTVIRCDASDYNMRAQQ